MDYTREENSYRVFIRWNVEVPGGVFGSMKTATASSVERILPAQTTYSHSYLGKGKSTEGPELL